MTRRDSLIPGWLAMSIQGDLGGWTIYTNKRRRKVFYPQAPPLSPPSMAQFAVRGRMIRAAAAWHTLPPDQRRNWRRACAAARLETVGFGLWYFWHFRRDMATIRTIERLTNIILLTDEAKNV